MLVIPSYKVEAKTLQDLKNELSSLEKKYEENNFKNLFTVGTGTDYYGIVVQFCCI